MSLSPGFLLAVLDDAIADSPWWRPRRVVLELVNERTVLGERGQRLPDEAGAHRYGFTRAQCKRMRAVILAAARADAGGA